MYPIGKHHVTEPPTQFTGGSIAAVAELDCLPYGIGQGEEGVCLLIRMGPHRILLDCGLHDLTPLIQQSTEGEPPIDLVICSHAHPDHARGLLAFHQTFPTVPIYASEVTTQLLPLYWPDLHPELDTVPFFCQALPWRSPLEFLDGLTAELWPSGHLLGAAAILLSYTPPHRSTSREAKAYTVFYTGDFFLSNTRLVQGLPLEELRGLKPDVLIVEGSYGTARNIHRRQQENQLAERINRAIAEQQSVLLPTPALGLGQELLMLLRSHHLFTGRDLDIWVDGMVAEGCDTYLSLLPYLPASVQNFARHQPLFWDDRVRPRVRHLRPDQRATLGHTPCIVLTDETIDLAEYCHHPDASWLILLPQHPGYPAFADPMQILAMVNPDASLSELDQPNPSSHLSLDTYFLAEHCDGSGTMQLIHNLRPQHVLFVHTPPPYLADLTSLDELSNRYQLHAPSAGMLVELPVGETFLQPAAPESRYEGELTENELGVTISLPETIVADPRWPAFSDTGLVSVRWQGDELVMRGLSQRELLSQGRDRPTTPDTECCTNCIHYRGQHCWNQSSPLYGFKVTPEGFCPAFMPIRPDFFDTLKS